MEGLRNLLTIIFILSSWGAVGAKEYFKYKDPKQPLNVRINDLLSRMTLAEKIGQMSQIERENATADVVRNYFIGTIAFPKNTLVNNEIWEWKIVYYFYKPNNCLQVVF